MTKAIATIEKPNRKTLKLLYNMMVFWSKLHFYNNKETLTHHVLSNANGMEAKAFLIFHIYFRLIDSRQRNYLN